MKRYRLKLTLPSTKVKAKIFGITIEVDPAKLFPNALTFVARLNEEAVENIFRAGLAFGQFGIGLEVEEAV